MSQYRSIERWAIAIALVLITVLAILRHTRPDGVVVVVLLSTLGIGVGLVARAPIRLWGLLLPVVAVITMVSQLVDGVGLVTALLVAACYVGALSAGGLILNGGGRRAASFASIQDLAMLALAAVVAGALASAGEVAAQVDLGGSSFQEAASLFTLHASAIVLTGGLVLAIDFEQLRPPEPVLVAAHSACLAAVSVLVFLDSDGSLPAWLAVPLLILGALRFSPFVVTAQLTVFSLFVRVCTANGKGPFGATEVDGFTLDAYSLWALAYLVSTAVIVYPLVVSTSQRRDLLVRVSAEEERFRRSFTNSALGMLFLESDDRGALVVTDANRAAATMLGAARSAVLGRRLDDILTTQGSLEDALAPLVRGDVDVVRDDAVALGRPGSWIRVAVAALELQGRPRAYSAQMLDTTQEHDALRRLTAAHRLTDATLDTTACIILVTDSSGSIVRVNAATKEVTGYDDSELVGQRVWDTPIAPLTRSESEAMFVWPNRSGFPIAREMTTYHADGSPLRIVWNNNVVRDEYALPAYAVLTGIDVTTERSTTGLVAHLLQASIATALIGIDNQGLITVFNAGAQHMLGYRPEEMIGRPFVDLLHREQLRARTGARGSNDAFTSLIGTIGDRDESLARDWSWVTKSGRQVIVSMTLSVTDDLVTDRVGFLCVGRDVTEQREGQETLVQALEKERTAVERLRLVDQAKDEFVSTVSHELRTPVTSIMGYTEMLLEGQAGDVSDEQRMLLSTIERNSQRLVAICNDLLLLGVFDNEPVSTLREKVDLRDCVLTIEESVRPQLEARELVVSFEPGSEPLCVLGDRGQLDRVVANLVSNAIKFTPDGGGIVVRLQRVDDRALLTIRDTGIGIPSEDHAAVFQRFFRTDAAHRRAIPGTGLGLSIVASIVEGHGGTIDLESVPDVGTTFRVLLPLT